MGDFEPWWQQHGQYSRAGGGDYEKTFAFNAWNAALTAAQPACTCPSGDGSLRHPCPSHPPSPPTGEGRIITALVRDLAENGLRFSLTPCFDWSSKETISAFWHGYMRSADELIRERAAQALAATPPAPAAEGGEVAEHQQRFRGEFEWSPWYRTTQECFDAAIKFPAPEVEVRALYSAPPVPPEVTDLPDEPTEAMRTAHAMYGDTSDWWETLRAALIAARTAAQEDTK